MDLTTIALLGIVAMLVLMFCGQHIGLAMLFVGFVGYYMISGSWDAALGVLRQVPATTASNFSLCVVPLFILMGNAAFAAGVSDGLFEAGDKWLSWLPGGLACATVAACAGFGAICGSAPATAATMGVVAVPKMREYGYQDVLSCGVVAVGGTLGILIPPSTPLIVYGIMSEQSIGKLFEAGVLPGIMLSILLILTVIIRVKLNPSLAPSTDRVITWRQRFKSLTGLGWVVVLFGVVLGGMFSGLFTVNESAAAGAFISLVIMAVRRRMTWKSFMSVMKDSIKSTAMVYLILVGADVFGKFLALTQLPMNLAGYIEALNVSRYVIILIIILVYAVMGCFMDALPMITLTVPIFLPVIQSLQFDPIWFGVLCIVVMQLGFITPPVGTCSYVIAGVIKDVSLGTVFRGVIAFVPAMLIGAVLLVIFPDIVLFLPSVLH